MTNLQIQFSSQTLTQAVALASPNKYGIIDISPHTIRWMQSAVTSLCRSTGNIEITAVAPRHIWQWQENQIRHHIKTITMNSYLRAIKTLYSRLQRNGITGHNPAQPILPLPEPLTTPRSITELNYLYMRNMAGNGRNIAILDTLWVTGCRAGELVGMDIERLSQWNDNGRCASIRVLGKGRQQRQVYWSGAPADSLAIWLNERPATQSAALFTTNRRRRFTLNSFSSLIRQIRITANVLNQNTNPHAFRHAFAIRKLNDGYDLPTVSQWLGHSSPEFTAAVYCVRTENELRQRFFQQP